jgi:benzoylformate decarboxylase
MLAGEMMLTVREMTLRLLRELGITTVFGNPGSTELPLFRDFPDDFRYVLGLQESVVLGMADGFAQVTRNAALVNLHSSAGTGHALGNLFTAWKNQTPLIVTAGQQARSILPFEPFLFAERPTEFPRPFVKWAIEPARAADVPRAIARAYYEAMTPPRGPTFVSIPVDDWDAEADVVQARRIAVLNPGDPAAVADLAQALGRATRPAFVLGAGVARDSAWDSLVLLAQQQRAAVFVAPLTSRNVFPEDHPLFRGFLPASREGMVKVLEGHDLIVSLGGPMSLYHTEGFGPHIPANAACWHISDHPGQLAWAPEGRAILANTRCVIEQLLKLTEPSQRPAPASRPLPPALDPQVLDDRLAMARIARALPANAIVVEEAPGSRGALQAHLKIVRPDSFYTTASGGLGYSLPASVGVSLGSPGRRVVAILGDGSAMYAIQGLYSAFQLRAPVTFIIINNRSYAALQNFGHVFGLDHVVGTDLQGLDFCSLALGHGVPAVRVTRAEELDLQLAKAFAAEGPQLIEVVVS